MSKSDAQSAAEKWQKLADTYQQAGIPEQVWAPIAKNDLTKVYTSGGSYAMSESEANAAVLGAYTNKSVINPHHSGGFLGDLKNAVGDTVSDASHIVTGLGPGLLEQAKGIVTGKSEEQMGDLLFGGNSDKSNQALAKAAGVNIDDYDPNKLSDLGETFRLFGATKLGSLIPGISDIAGATTSKGAHSLAQHPLSTALDILPFAKGAGEAAGAARVADTEAGTAAQTAREAAVDQARTKAADDGRTGLRSERRAQRLGDEAYRKSLKSDPTAASALARGHLMQATARLIDRQGLSNLTSHRFAPTALSDATDAARIQNLGVGQRAVRGAVGRFGYSPESRELNTGLARQTRMGEKEIGNVAQAQVTDGVFQPLLDQAKEDGVDPQTAMAQFSQKITEGDTSDLTPVEQQVVQNIQTWNKENLQDPALDSGELVRVGQGVYAPDSVVAKTNAVHVRAADLADRRATQLQAAQDRLDAAQQGLLDSNAGNPIPSVAGHLESGPDAFARTEQIRTPDTIRAALAPTTRDFVDTDPQWDIRRPTNSLTGMVKARMDGMTPANRSIVLGRVSKLVGKQGLFAKMDKAFSDGDIAKGKSYLSQISRALNSPKVLALPELARTYDYINQLRGEVTGFASKSRHDRALVRETYHATRGLEKSKAAHERAQSRLQRASDNAKREYYKNPPAQLHTHIRNEVRKAFQTTGDQFNDRRVASAAFARASQLQTVDEMDRFRQSLEAVSSPERSAQLSDYVNVVGKSEFDGLFNDAVDSALDLDRQGIGPVYSHAIQRTDINNLGRIHIAKTSDQLESQIRDKAFNMNDSVFDVRASMIKAAQNQIERKGMQKVYDQYIKPHVKTRSQIEGEMAAIAKVQADRYPSETLRTVTENEMKNNWVNYDFDSYGIRRGTIGKTTDTYIPKTLADTLDSWAKRTGPVEDTPIRAAGRVGMKIFKTSVLYGPRHWVHVVAGGAMPLLAEDAMSFTKVPAAVRAIRSGEMPEELGAPKDWTADQVYHYKTGSRMATLLHDFWQKTGAKPGEALTRSEEYVQKVYQMSAYLRKVQDGADPMTAVHYARDMVVNSDSMPLFERNVLRQVMPFWSFTRWATSFMVNLASDHPLKVSILSSIANQANEDWNSLLPQQLQSVFFLGNTNSDGMVSGINFRNLNPFRSVFNTYTMTGFLQALNPALQTAAEAYGINTYTGSSEMYPTLGYDPTTGRLVSTRPKTSAMSEMANYTPEIKGIEDVVADADNKRVASSSGTDTFWSTLQNDFNIPFAYQKYNLPTVKAKTVEAQYQAANNAVKNFEYKGKNPQSLEQFSQIPVNISGSTQYMTPEQFLNWWHQQSAAVQQQTGIKNANPLQFQEQKY